MKIIYAITAVIILGLFSCSKQTKVVYDQHAKIQFKCLEGQIKVLDEREVRILGDDWLSKEEYVETLFALVGSIEYAENAYEGIRKLFYIPCQSD